MRFAAYSETISGTGKRGWRDCVGGRNFRRAAGADCAKAIPQACCDTGNPIFGKNASGRIIDSGQGRSGKNNERGNNLRQYEPFKRLFRIGSAAILMGVITGVYGCVWNGYFNKLIEFPFWRRGNWLMIALYAGLLFFFLMTYGGFRIGYLKKGNLLCSQILSIGLLNVITYEGMKKSL